VHSLLQWKINEKESILAGHQWLMLIILVTENRRIMVPVQHRQIVWESLSSKITRTKKWTGSMAQVVECLLCKWEALSSNPCLTKKKKISNWWMNVTRTLLSFFLLSLSCLLTLGYVCVWELSLLLHNHIVQIKKPTDSNTSYPQALCDFRIRARVGFKVHSAIGILQSILFGRNRDSYGTNSGVGVRCSDWHFQCNYCRHGTSNVSS
jgi:hypothetical protein